MKYYVRLIRLEPMAAVVEVEAGSAEEAALVAAESVSGLGSRDWAGLARDGDYAPMVDAVIPSTEFDYEPPSSAWPRTAFALLRADLESMEGRLVAQPWMFSLDGLAQADLATEWLEEMQGLSEQGLVAWANSAGGDDLQRIGAALLRAKAK